eukprot:607559-Prymnesium_polylepis.1
MPDASTSTWSKRFSAARADSDVNRSSRSVQQMQPFDNSTIFSSCWRTPARRTNSASMLTDAMSFTTTAMRQPARFCSRCLSSVVLPAPRKPESTVTGKGGAALWSAAARTTFVASFTTDSGLSTGTGCAAAPAFESSAVLRAGATPRAIAVRIWSTFVSSRASCNAMSACEGCAAVAKRGASGATDPSGAGGADCG